HLVGAGLRLRALDLLDLALAQRLLQREVLAVVPPLQLFYRHTATHRFALDGMQLGEREQRGAHSVHRVVVAQRLGEYVFDARTYRAVTIAHHDYRAEAEAASTLDHLGHAVHLHQLLLRSVGALSILTIVPPLRILDFGFWILD